MNADRTTTTVPTGTGPVCELVVLAELFLNNNTKQSSSFELDGFRRQMFSLGLVVLTFPIVGICVSSQFLLVV